MTRLQGIKCKPDLDKFFYYAESSGIASSRDEADFATVWLTNLQKHTGFENVRTSICPRFKGLTLPTVPQFPPADSLEGSPPCQ